MDYEAEPTIVPASGFNASEDASVLRAAMKGFGTDEQAIIDLLTTRSNSQRLAIAEVFKNELGRDLIDDLKSELGGHFEDVIVALCLPPDVYLCKQLHKAMDGMGTDEETLIEILCPRSNEEVKRLVSVYEDLYDRPLAEHLCSEVDGHFRRLLTLIVTGVRDAAGTTDPDKAKEQASQLYEAGEGKLGTDEEVFNRIFAHSSFAQLRLVFEEYKELTGRTIEQALKEEVGGDLADALKAIVECVQSPPAFFARRLRDAMQGAGTNDVTLIRIVVSRSEIDLGTIKAEYERIYDKTLLSEIQGETSGDYKRSLCAILGGA